MEKLDFKGFVEGMWMPDEKAVVGLSKIKEPSAPPAKLPKPKNAVKLVGK